MEIKLAKETKRQIESEIRAILCMFENQTGLSVSDIDILTHKSIGSISTKVIAVYIKTEL